MLLWQIERLKRSRLVDQVIVATTTSPLDDQIVEFCVANNVKYFRGSEKDVLARIATLLIDVGAITHVECYGDSPLIDPQIVDEFLGYFLKHKNNLDYVSSTIKTTYPAGLEFSVYKAEVLIRVNDIVEKVDPLREHVGYNITRFTSLFRLKSIDAPFWFQAPNIYLEVDVPKDLEVIEKIFSHFLSKEQEHFGLGEILALIKEKPDIASGNVDVHRRWKEFRD